MALGPPSPPAPETALLAAAPLAAAATQISGALYGLSSRLARERPSPLDGKAPRHQGTKALRHTRHGAPG